MSKSKSFKKKDGSVFVTVPTPPSKFPTPKPKKDTVDVDAETNQAVDRAKKSSFAIAANIKQKFKVAGITDDDLWGYIKHSYKVKSRKELNEKQWVRIEARLRAASHNYRLLNLLISKIQKWKEGNSDGEDSESMHKRSGT